MFKCEKCGCCCRNLDKSLLYYDLDRGDGVCRYLEGDICSIYEQRPLLCRVDECYDIFFAAYMSRNEYYDLNKKACKELRKEEEKLCHYHLF